MNIFVLDEDPVRAAQYNCDTHVCKIILEAAQLMALAHDNLDHAPEPVKSYRAKPFLNHPITKWVKTSLPNYQWLAEHARKLCEEYTTRYNRSHATEPIVLWLYENQPALELATSHTQFVQAMPDEYKKPCAVDAYRNLYKTAKRHLVKYRLGNYPAWFSN